MKKLILSLLLVILCPLLSQGWGFFGHRTIAQISVYALPSSMRGFYYRHMAELVKRSTAADERREADPTEAPKHFIDMDHYGDNPFGLMPKLYDKAVAKYTADTLRKYGTVPWTVMELKEQLTDAFRKGDTVAIVRLSADLGHYVSDAFVPLHTTENYDGQLTNQAGIHSLWESKLPERNIAKYKLDAEPASYLKDPQTDIWKVVQSSYGFLGATFDYEDDLNRKFTPEQKYVFSHKYGKTRRSYSDAFADAYHEKVGGMVAYRLKQAPTMVASMWLTAWKDAGSPNLDAMMTKKPSKEEKEKLAAELKIWDKNELVNQQMLLSLQKVEQEVRPDLINAAQDMAPVPDEPTPAATAPTGSPVPGAPPVPAGTNKVKVKTKEPNAPAQKQKAKAAPAPKKKADDGWGAPSGSGW
ncbi:hypothetical protein HMJ29_12285 [Hymenobacter taeanensis]|uniref:S1/P1 Nuclease n=1 Tax=Hymenobacter taeanensis TaxID=2735321 RepID=A0A6M6BIG8_9BACT|nr:MULTISPECIES: zinc dependent phospholipase C family protein [Hymenobacter]QJX47678.1 hypothetical protein HMJ29_12285 [Hymenobacter taeanensis]UOQ82839.1 zinc dependent phospholipase C family protein [Hymenobacter sp. 5414T-23]